MPKDGGIGASTKRREDVRFLTGTGHYTDDINLRGQAHVHFLRSDVAHGRLNTVDTSAAAALRGTHRALAVARSKSPRSTSALHRFAGRSPSRPTRPARASTEQEATDARRPIGDLSSTGARV